MAECATGSYTKSLRPVSSQQQHRDISTMDSRTHQMRTTIFLGGWGDYRWCFILFSYIYITCYCSSFMSGIIKGKYGCQYLKQAELKLSIDFGIFFRMVNSDPKAGHALAILGKSHSVTMGLCPSCINDAVASRCCVNRSCNKWEKISHLSIFIFENCLYSNHGAVLRLIRCLWWKFKDTVIKKC